MVSELISHCQRRDLLTRGAARLVEPKISKKVAFLAIFWIFRIYGDAFAALMGVIRGVAG